MTQAQTPGEAESGHHEAGNTFFKNKDYASAIESYRKAIETDRTNTILFSNLALCYLKTNEHTAAARCAHQALLLDPENTKAKHRLALANFALKNYVDALEQLLPQLENTPTKRTHEMIGVCRKEIRIARLSSAINIDTFFVTARLVAQTSLPPTYTGPLLDSAQVTEEFAFSLLQHFREEKKLPVKYIYAVLLGARSEMLKSPNVVSVVKEKDTRLTICGDVHGQFFDVLKIFENNGYPSKKHIYVFNGDFVDRGAHSVETALALLAFKACLPKHFFISKGNHETESMNRFFGFEEEAIRKHGKQIYALFREVFNTLPIAHVVQNKYFVVHGGIPSSEVTLDDINRLNRFADPGPKTLFSGLLWSDPGDEDGLHPNPRNEGVLFGRDVTERFLEKNSLDTLIRSHVWKQDGYEFEHHGKCLTIFSAPNYTGAKSNAAFINLAEDDKLDIIQFDSALRQGLEAQKPLVPDIPGT
ncbi:MAG: serine/threonine-protein phosphatase 5 [Amphiamblys sp. WSBS2006]|nr:MAG: serine/threonine-protein phosphatase 5 [Amphiamblys sp. WSBS2006]OIR59029.1 MAG: serine/threonine-protein phosphatase 5 [Amphiamblys sp. WSBS2006]